MVLTQPCGSGVSASRRGSPASGLIQDGIVSPLRTHDITHAAKLHGHLRPGDILLGDRAFESFAHLEAKKEAKQGSGIILSLRP